VILSPADVEEIHRALDSVVWLGRNLHNYGTPEWRDLFLGALDDVERARLVLGSTGPGHVRA
jgi:hypothetical protein